MASFYGNVTKSSRTQFQFDRVYPNRVKMEQEKDTDGIYMGRFVLVDYDEGATKQYKKIYTKEDKYYFLSTDSKLTEVLYPTNVKRGQLVLITAYANTEDSVMDESQFYIYRCSNKEDPENLAEPIPATFMRVTSENASNAYVNNFEIDKREYGASRGYDSTVWQKVFVNNEEKYVMIAELNAVVPTFDIVVDAPTLEPIAPHFDRVSNSVYYKVHYQPQWGMRVKAAEPEAGTSSDMTTTQSDEKVTWKHYSYDKTEDTENIETEEIDGAIYYNKAGFNKNQISYSDAKKEGIEEKDKITITPTGISGYDYNIHNGINNPKETAKKEDIQEVSIILPSIGDSIAEMWDLVYGNSEQNDNKLERNLNIEWDSTEGLRMVKEKEDGNGWTYEPNKVETLAGGINAIHDLMGMIIVDKEGLYPQIPDENILDEEEQNEIASTVNLDNIYYDLTTSTYNRKIKKFKYDNILNTDEIYSYDKVDLTVEPYKPNTYFIQEDNEYIPDSNTNGNSGTYYKRLLNVSPLEQVTLVNWEPNKYFYKEKDNNNNTIYILDSGAKRDEDKVYYSIEGFSEVKDENNNIIIPFELENTYESDKFWYESVSEEIESSEDNKYYDYKKEVGDNPTLDKKYFLINYNLLTEDGIVVKPYIPDKYAYIDSYKDETGNDITVLKTCSMEDSEYLEKKPDLYDTTGIETITKIIPVWDENTKETIFVTVSVFDIEFDEEGKINLPIEKVVVLSEENKEYYYKENNTDNFIRINNSEIAKNKNVENIYILDKTSVAKFYIPSTYYYKPFPNIKRYILDTNEESTEGRLYYSPDLTTEKIITNFYEPNKYYYETEDGNKIIDKNLIKTENRVYYIGEDFYVSVDNQNIFNIYALWNNNVKLVPSSITLARREDRWGFKELDGFARSMNTIHGLILEVNKLMEFDNIYTRELDTVQGCINKLNDIIFKFDQLTPGNILVVDSYGRVHGATYTTAQTFGYTNIGKDEVEANEKAAENQWISLQVNDDVKEPKIIIKHNFTEVTSTETISDKNGSVIPEDLPIGINHNTNDILELYSPIVDKTGHIVGNNYEKVTLPYGYKTFKDSNPTVGSSVASNTQDIFVFKGDSWINPTVSNDLLALTHTGPIGTAPAAKDAVTPVFGETFIVDDWYFDDKGHKYAGGTHTIKIPQPSLKTLGEIDDETSWVLTKLELNDTKGELTQTVNKIGNLTLSGYQQPESGVFGPEDTLNTAFNKLQIQTIDLQEQINQEKTNREAAVTKITGGDSTETIASLLRKINTLQESYNVLLAKVEILESYHTEENA